jgi:ankyrin repeat protein
MGVPIPQDPSTESQAQTSKPIVTQLPPEAIALASKLFDFAREGKTAELQQYITAGIPVNLTNHKGDTILMLASYYGHLSTTKMLLDAGADPNVLNERGQSPIAGTVFKGYTEIAQTLLAKGADVHAGQPNAVDSAKMFKRVELFGVFGIEEES